MLFKKNADESKDNTKHNIENIFKAIRESAAVDGLKNVFEKGKTKVLALIAHEKVADKAKKVKPVPCTRYPPG